MIKSQGLLDYVDKSSLVRQILNQDFDLSMFEIPQIQVPHGFKNFSFVPGEKGLELVSCMDKLEEYLIKNKISKSKFNLIIPGVAEALKNAYEHGNLKENSKKIHWYNSIKDNDEIEFFIGDEGGKINGNLFSYALGMKEAKRFDLASFPDFYSFCGKNYAPLGHSGAGTKTMNHCFDKVIYFKNSLNGLTVYLGKKLNH